MQSSHKQDKIMTPMKHKLRILRFTDIIGYTNAPYYNFSLYRKHDYDITIVTYFGSDISPPQEIKVYEGDASLRGYLRLLHYLIEHEDFDILHIHSPYAGLFFLLRYFWRGDLRRRTIYTVHNSFANFKLRHKLLMLFSFAAMERVVTCSYAAYDSLPLLYKRLAGQRLKAVPNGVNLPLIDAVLSEPALNDRGDESPFTIVWIGRLIPIKQPLSALEAFANLSSDEARLIYIGDGPLRAALEARIAALGLQNRVMLTGLIERERVFRHLAKADVFFSTSLGEGLPVAVLEAMGCHCPVILSDIAPHREIGDKASFIPLINPTQITGFTQALDELSAISTDARKQLGTQCRQIVEQHFSLDRMHEQYDMIYQDILGNRV